MSDAEKIVKDLINTTLRSDADTTDALIRKVKAETLREAAGKLRKGAGSCNKRCHDCDAMTLRILADRIEVDS